ncbi:MAG TPA: hypothetical protein PKM21_00815 [Anaerolineales bacterium]|nr:hypothetical protein [Anaerolineales bacterium]
MADEAKLVNAKAGMFNTGQGEMVRQWFRDEDCCKRDLAATQMHTRRIFSMLPTARSKTTSQYQPVRLMEKQGEKSKSHVGNETSTFTITKIDWRVKHFPFTLHGAGSPEPPLPPK